MEGRDGATAATAASAVELAGSAGDAFGGSPLVADNALDPRGLAPLLAPGALQPSALLDVIRLYGADERGQLCLQIKFAPVWQMPRTLSSKYSHKPSKTFLPFLSRAKSLAVVIDDFTSYAAVLAPSALHVSRSLSPTL